MSLDSMARGRIRDFIRVNADAGQPPTAKQVLVHFRLRDDDMPDIRDLMTEVALLGCCRDHEPRPEITFHPLVILDSLLGWLASPAVTLDETRHLLLECPWCRNHLLYVLDTAPYSGQGYASVRNRLLALPEVHKAHGPDGPDQDRPSIRWITP